jgi:hypothetical protein
MTMAAMRSNPITNKNRFFFISYYLSFLCMSRIGLRVSSIAMIETKRKILDDERQASYGFQGRLLVETEYLWILPGFV